MGIIRETMGCYCTKDERIPAREAADSASAPPPQPSTTPLQQVLQEAQRNSAQANATIAESYAECPICFDPLHEDQCVSLHRGQHRSCRHIVHERCANAMLRRGQAFCCECRGEFDSIQRIPELRVDRKGLETWFRAVDVDNDGRLSRWEVLLALKAQCRLDWDALEQHITSLWVRWDTDGSGFIEFDELCDPDGLVAYVKADAVAHQYHYIAPLTQPPSLEDRAKWFRFWDSDQNGVLDVEETRRALIKTFDLGRPDNVTVAHRHCMQESLAAAWPLFDPDMKGNIDFDSFTRPGGLGETIELSVEQLQKEHVARDQIGTSSLKMAWNSVIEVAQAPVSLVARQLCMEKDPTTNTRRTLAIA